jgi:hypothetical protein
MWNILTKSRKLLVNDTYASQPKRLITLKHGDDNGFIMMAARIHSASEAIDEVVRNVTRRLKVRGKGMDVLSIHSDKLFYKPFERDPFCV